MKNKQILKPIDTTELEFKSKEEFLAWREETLRKYEEHKIQYDKEMRKFLGYEDEDNNE